MANKMTLFDRAYAFADRKHAGQFRDGGAPFILHPVQTAQIIINVAIEDENLIAAALLHDTVEDTDTTLAELALEFGPDVANLVYEVTETENNVFPNLKSRRGIMLKFADRLSNLSGMEGWTPERQQKYLDKSKFWSDTEASM